MSRSVCAAVAALAFAAMAAGVVWAAEPVVTKRVATEHEDAALLVVEVRAADQAIYSVALADETGSVTDVVAPKGWAGISSGDRVVFATADTPIKPGERVSFKIVTTDKSAPLSVTFRDGKRMMLHAKQTI